MLREEMLWGPRDKVQIAIERLRTFEPPEGYYLAFSGGIERDAAARYAAGRDALRRYVNERPAPSKTPPPKGMGPGSAT